MNFKNPYGRRLGEIDIIARKGNDMVFVEVKTRIFDKYDDNLPEESITPAKLHKLNKIANFYIKTNKLWENPYHFDAVSVWIDEDGKLAKIKHIENIFY
jgi:putative endonuclease